MKSSKKKTGSGRTRLSEERPWTPYRGPYHIPALVDDVKRLGAFEMTRLLFFTIDATGTMEDWVSYLRVQQIPFLLFGLTAVIHRPNLKSVKFITADHVNGLFNGIEDSEGLLVETEHLWLPNFLFEDEGGRWKMGSGGEGSAGARGDVWRVAYDLFQQALRFRQEHIGRSQFLESCRALGTEEEPAVTYSREETGVFREWSASQFEEARANYQEQRADPSRGVLGWIDDAGNYRAG